MFQKRHQSYFSWFCVVIVRVLLLVSLTSLGSIVGGGTSGNRPEESTMLDRAKMVAGEGGREKSIVAGKLPPQLPHVSAILFIY